MSAQDLAFNLIWTYEDVKLAAYKDTGDIWTIGFGHTGTDVTPGLTITMQQAMDLYAKDSAPLFALVADKSPAAQAGYASFGYNCGPGALKHVLSGIAKMEEFVHDRHNNELPWLLKRRGVELALVNL